MLNFCLWTTDKIIIVMKKFFLMAALLLGISSFSFAQDINWGVRASLGFGHAVGSIKSDDFKYPGQKYGAKVGFSIGGIADIKISENFYLQPGLYYINKGYSSSFKEDEYKYTQTTNLHYLEIPVLASYRHSINNDIELQGNFGPYIAVGLGGKIKWSEKEDNEELNGNYPAFGVDEKESRGDLKRFDFGLSFGAGVTMKEHYYVGIKYDLGLLNMLNTKDEHSGYYYKYYKDEKAPRALQGNFSICLGYNF